MKAFLTVAAVLLCSLPSHAQEVWVRALQSTGADFCRHVAARDGFVYTVGSFSNTLTVGTQTVASAGESDIFLAKHSSSGEFVWLKRAGSVGQDFGYGVAIDRSGNVVISGTCSRDSPTTFDDTSFTTSGFALAKYTSGGDLLWARGTTVDVSGGGYSEGVAVAVDDAGNVYSTGQFNGGLSFEQKSISPRGEYDVFVVRYSSDGVPQWALAGGSSKMDIGYDLAVHGNAVYVTGTIGYDGHFGDFTLFNRGRKDAFLAKINAASGGVLWAKPGGSERDDVGHGVVADAGHVYFTGHFAQVGLFDTVRIETTGASDGFIACFSVDGNAEWVSPITGAENAFAAAVALSGNELVVAGDFEGYTTFGGSSLQAGGSRDGFIARYGTNGEVIDVTQLGMSTRPVVVRDVAVDAGGIVFAGNFEEALSVGDTTIYNVGDVDCFVGVLLQTSTSVLEPARLPVAVSLHGNALEISYAITGTASVRVSVLDVFGRVVAEHGFGIQSPGQHAHTLNLPGMASGLYFAVVEIGGVAATHPLYIVQ